MCVFSFCSDSSSTLHSPVQLRAWRFISNLTYSHFHFEFLRDWRALSFTEHHKVLRFVRGFLLVFEMSCKVRLEQQLAQTVVDLRCLYIVVCLLQGPCSDWWPGSCFSTVPSSWGRFVPPREDRGKEAAREKGRWTVDLPGAFIQRTATFN